MKQTIRVFSGFALSIVLLGCQPTSYQPIEHGVVIQPQEGEARLIGVQVYRDNIFRITALPHTSPGVLSNSIQVVAEPDAKFKVRRERHNIRVTTRKGSALINPKNGKVAIYDARGQLLLDAVNSGEFGPVTEDPTTPDLNSYALRQQWNKNSDEGFFGLGQHQNGLVNYAGETVELSTHNLEFSVPMLVSSRGYGMLWDNASITRLGDPNGYQALNESLVLYDENGVAGGLTARYYDGDELLLTRTEAEPDYQFLVNNNVREHPFPAELQDVSNPHVIWSGSIQSDTSGEHVFKMYSSGYTRLSLNHEEVLNRWRMNWNPWYHDVRLNMTAGQKVPIEIDWDSQGGYFRLNHIPPRPSAEQHSLSLASESGKAIDYYVIVGTDYDSVISGYRELTGDAVMLPKWAYGFWQSRERYQNQDELVDVVREYRQRGIPLDNIVLDWFYWPEDAWGSHQFEALNFPDPQKMVDEVHELNANIMISVWPKFYPTTEHYKELDEKGYMLNKNVEVEANRDWVGPGYLNGFYDPYPREAQQIFWRQIRDNLNVLGFDAWWLDATEPDIHSNLTISKRKEITTPLAVGSGTEYFNSYAVPNAEGVYLGERETDPEKRSFILTRSGFGGIQRTGAAVWSGDTVSRWSNLKDQIAAGIGAGLAGVPNWSMDIGGFTPENQYRYGSDDIVHNYADMPADYVQNWQELNLRWFQFGAFVPLFRSHGQNPYREIYNIAEQGSDIYESMVYYAKLRYRLMPYIYSEAGHLYLNDGTLMRGLVMDFMDDPNVFDINDQYMFGPALLVNPVYQPGATSRPVYLPEGTLWYDFYSGKVFDGGQNVEAAAPLNRMPIFARAGAILPSGPEIQTVFEQPDAPLQLTVYAGADGRYDLYEDDGRSYNYEHGKYSIIPIYYDDESRTLRIGARQGSYSGMLKEREFRVRLVEGENSDASNFDSAALTVNYRGETVDVTL